MTANDFDCCAPTPPVVTGGGGEVLGEEARQAVATALLIEYVDPEENPDGAAGWQHRQADDAAATVLTELAPHVAALVAQARVVVADEERKALAAEVETLADESFNALPSDPFRGWRSSERLRSLADEWRKRGSS